MKASPLRWKQLKNEVWRGKETLLVETWQSSDNRYRVYRVTHESKNPYTVVNADHAVEFKETYWMPVGRYCRSVKAAMRVCNKHNGSKDGTLPKVEKPECRVKSWPRHEDIYKR